jgi:hypothetical protein
MMDDESRQVRQACFLQGETVAELRERREGYAKGRGWSAKDQHCQAGRADVGPD